MLQSIRRLAAAATDRFLDRAAPTLQNIRRTQELYRDHIARCAAYPTRAASSPAVASILEAVRNQGYHVVPGYWDREKCAAAVREVDRIMRQYPRFVLGPPKSDFRLFGADNLSALIAEFGNDPMLVEVASLHNRMPTRLGMTLAARLPAAADNLGSGEGWHRDQFFVSTKSMLYLTDVSGENGPFQMIDRSTTVDDVCRDMKECRLEHLQYRIRDEQVAKLVELQPARLLTFAASAGTLLVFNASSIHRGKPITSGERYALTNYYFTAEWSDEEIFRHFPPIATAHVRAG
jgi:hypothetical protein